MEMTQALIEFNWSSLMILCNVFILYIILRKFFWEKIKKFMDDRAAAVQDAIDEAAFDPRAANLDLYGGVGLLAAAVVAFCVFSAVMASKAKKNKE
jgi:hypothetical protein